VLSWICSEEVIHLVFPSSAAFQVPVINNLLRRWLARKFEEELSWIRIKGKDSLHVDVKLREWIRQQEAGAGFYGMPVIGANLSDGPGNIFHGILVQNRRDFTSVRREERAENATEQ